MVRGGEVAGCLLRASAVLLFRTIHSGPRDRGEAGPAGGRGAGVRRGRSGICFLGDEACSESGVLGPA